MRLGGYQLRWLNIVAGGLLFLITGFFFLLFNGPTRCGLDGRVVLGACRPESSPGIAAFVLPLLGMVVGILIVMTGIERLTDD